MRLVKIKLCPQNPFWFLGDIINLTKENPESPLINLDSLEEEQVKTINQAANQMEVKLFDSEGNKLKKTNDAIFISGDHAVDVNDIDKEESEQDFLGIESVTVSEESEESEEKQIIVEEQDLKDASIFLSKNGNTVRKMIKSLPRSDDSLVFLHALLQVESSTKNRHGVVSRIEEVIDECQQ